jgi:hypothetical protein
MLALMSQLDASKAAPVVRPATPALVKVPDVYDVAVWALEDAVALRAREQSAKHCFYLWVGPNAGPEVAKINSLAVNSSLSHSSTIQLPELTAGGRLIRWNLSQLAPRDKDFNRLVGIINFLSSGEPYWHVDLKALGLPPAKTDPFLWLDGKVYDKAFSVPAPVTAEAYTLLQQETGLRTPLMRADYFLRKISSTIQGGVYYHARGFIVYDQHGKQKRLNETEIFALFGNDVKLSRKVEGDDRVGITISGVTAQARAVEFGQGAIGGWRITYDRFSDNEQLGAHPLYNLLSVVDKADGRETIFEMPNGLLAYILTNGKGELVDEAPNKLVTDHRTRVPHPAQLFPPLSCVRCHGPNGGVQRTPNDVARLLRDPKQLDAFADFGGTGFTTADVDRLAGLYGGDFEKRSRDARDRYADACFKATRGLTAAQAAAEWSAQYENYWQSPVTAQSQLLEIGWGKPRSPQALNKSLETLQAKPENDLLIFGQPAQRLDPLIPAPRLGVPIRRQDQERTFAEQFRRAYLHRHEVN